MNYVNVFHIRAGHTSELDTPPKTRQLIYPLLLQPPTMPPIRSQSSKNLAEQEGRILLAIQAFKNREISSIHKTARRFNIPNSTLATHLHRV